MTDRYEALRAALAAGPTEGPYRTGDSSICREEWSCHSEDGASCWQPITAGNRKTILLVVDSSDGWQADRPSFDADAAMHAACDPATIRELLAEREALQWRPIETAPKDGSLFLCWVSASRWSSPDGNDSSHEHDVSQVDFCSWRDGPPDLPGHGYFDPCCGQIGDSQDVTHWMPMPAAPEAAPSLPASGAEPTARKVPMTRAEIDASIGHDEGDREAVEAVVREVERWHGIAPISTLTECHDNDSPWLVCVTCAAVGRCKNATPASAPPAEPSALHAHALEECYQLGYTVRDGLLYPPEAGLPIAANADALEGLTDEQIDALIRDISRAVENRIVGAGLPMHGDWPTLYRAKIRAALSTPHADRGMVPLTDDDVLARGPAGITKHSYLRGWRDAERAHGITASASAAEGGA